MNKDDKSDDEKAVGDLLKDWPNPKSGAGSPRNVHTAHGSPTIPAIKAGGHTITSSAYTSAQMFNPEQADLINGYMQSLKQAEKGDVFALAGGKVQPKDVGIATTLDPEVTQTYADFELSERNTREHRDHELDIEDAKTSGAMTVELWKAVVGIIVAIVVTLLGVKTLG